MANYDALVIGAGAAGLSAAAALGDAGLRVLVLEARERVGGRIHTLRELDVPVPIELGAEFVHGRPEETMALAQRAGLAVYPVADRHLRRTERGLEDVDEFWTEMRRVLDRLDPDGPDTTFAEFLLHRASEPELANARRLAARYVEGFHAADLAVVSARAVAQAEGGSASGASEALRILNGYAAIVGELNRAAGECGAEVRLGHEVTAVRWRRGDVAVETRTSDGARASFTAPRAVITIPLGVLQQDAIAISPFPPAWREALGGLRVGHVVRTVLRFRQRFWDDDASFVHHPESPRWQLWWTPAPIQAPLLTGWCGGPPAVRLAALGAEAMLTQAVADLSGLFEVPVARLRELLAGAHLHDWSADPWSRGAYTYVAAGGSEAAERLAEPLEGTLIAAGEAAAPAGRLGTVDGAIASGRRAAARLIGTA